MSGDARRAGPDGYGRLMSIPTAAAPTQPTLAYALADARGQLLAAERADHPFYAASTIKLHVLLAALQAADGTGAGEDGPGDEPLLDLDQSVPATRTFLGADGKPFTLGGDHLDATHPAERSPVTVRELLRRMIDRSSNEATDHVLTLIGLDAVAEAIAGLGLSGTRVERLIGDAAAIERDLTNETTPADLVATVRALVAPRTGEGRGADGRGTWLSPSSRELAREALAAQQIPIIATALRPGVPVGSKSGWVDGYRHDVAVIGDPGAPAGQGSGAGRQEARYLAVMTSGMGEAEADAAIRERVRALLPQLAD